MRGYCATHWADWRNSAGFQRWKMPLVRCLPSVESLNWILCLSWSCIFLMYVIPVHSIRQSVSCVTMLGICLSSLSFSKHTIVPAASRRGDRRPTDTNTEKYLDIMFTTTENRRLCWWAVDCLLIEVVSVPDQILLVQLENHELQSHCSQNKKLKSHECACRASENLKDFWNVRNMLLSCSPAHQRQECGAKISSPAIPSLLSKHELSDWREAPNAWFTDRCNEMLIFSGDAEANLNSINKGMQKLVLNHLYSYNC